MPPVWHRAITSRGAVLVRPDGYVAFRSMHSVEDPYATLAAAVSQILATTPSDELGGSAGVDRQLAQ